MTPRCVAQEVAAGTPSCRTTPQSFRRIRFARLYQVRAIATAPRARAAVRVFVCGEASLTLDRVKPGMTVSVFYEVVGTDGVVNTIVVEPPR